MPLRSIPSDINDVGCAALVVEYDRVSIAAGGKREYTTLVIYAPKENTREIVDMALAYFPRKEECGEEVRGELVTALTQLFKVGR